MKSISFTSIPLAHRPADQRVWQVITEQAQANQAIIYEEHGSYSVQFPDEEEPIPFEEEDH